MRQDTLEYRDNAIECYFCSYQLSGLPLVVFLVPGVYQLHVQLSWKIQRRIHYL